MLLAAGWLGSLAADARGQIHQLEIGVRSTVVDKPAASGKSGPPEAPEHGKVYAIFTVQLIPAQEKLVKPVDANVLMNQVRRELDAHGFRPVLKGQLPEILITVQYGRAFVRNPYYGDEQAKDTGHGPPQRNISLGSTLSARQTVAGFEAKAQKAEYEKLCVKLIAWEYPRDPKARAKQLWHTTMVVDDPEHRDLNTIAAEMLAAGAPYFGREIQEEEVEVYKPLPEGRVKVGVPEEVGPATK